MLAKLLLLRWRDLGFVIWGTFLGPLLHLCVLLPYFQKSAHGLQGLSTVGGSFMYGHINWNSSSKNTVRFHIEAGYRRNILTSFWKNGQAQVGDILQMADIGIGSTTFYFGDGTFTNDLKLRVTAFSASEDWIMGELDLTHKYATPSDDGRNWVASLSGCCRIESLAVQKDADFNVQAYVNLLEAQHSPVARSLPLLTSYLQSGASSGQVQLSNVFVHADDPQGTKEIEWSIKQPWNVGNAANFSSALSSFVSISLFDLSTAGQCERTAAGQTTGLGIGPACLFGLLRTDFQQLQTNKLTIEGWVKARAPGYVLSVGPDRCSNQNGGCSLTQNLDSCTVSAVSPFQTCSISTL
jgi:hypothetical protein